MATTDLPIVPLDNVSYVYLCLPILLMIIWLRYCRLTILTCEDIKGLVRRSQQYRLSKIAQIAELFFSQNFSLRVLFRFASLDQPFIRTKHITVFCTEIFFV